MLNIQKSLAIAALALGTATSAFASDITVSTGYSTAGAQASANDYRDVVNAAVAIPSLGYGSTSVALYDGISNHSVFGGSTGNIAFKSVIDFGVSAPLAGSWDFRFGVDFGNGGAVFLDGSALAFKSNDMWWAGSYSNNTQAFLFNGLNLAAGNHKFVIYGLEGCCDGGQQAQFRAPGANGFTTFGAQDGLNVAAVPEPETYAMLLAGIGLMGTIARRRRKD